MQYFIDVILPLPLPKPYTYWVEEDEFYFLQAGHRVVVPFGKNKLHTAVVVKKHQIAPQTYTPKTLELILDETPIITEKQLAFWDWMSSYYLCTLGDVLRAALPNAFLLSSETEFQKNTAAEVDLQLLSDDAFLVYEALEQRSLSLDEIQAILGRKKVHPIIQEMLERGWIVTYQKLAEKYKPKRLRFVRLAAPYKTDKALAELFDSLSRAPQQSAVLLHYCQQSANFEWLATQKLQIKGKSSSPSIKALIEKGVFEEEYFQEDRALFDPTATVPKNTLSAVQKKALEATQTAFQSHEVVLFHGVTASGKTEVYFELIDAHLEKGEQVLFLLPEISLTAQMILRLQRRFGDKVTVFHSKYSIHERVEVWKSIINKSEKAQIILGARSAIFLPFQNLGLVIVDEEHEASYKQFDPAPRYLARDAAIVLARLHSAKTLLGSATPSIESQYNVEKKKYGYVPLKDRFGGVQLPFISCIDLKEAYKKKLMNGVFSHALIEAIKTALEEKKQVILFQNRRGYAPILECHSCGHIPQCSNCDVTLTYHQYNQQLRCHYCGYNVAKPLQCNACGTNALVLKGTGTQQIEEQVENLFPEANVGRMDFDSTRGKRSFDKIIGDFTAGRLNILIGTQMVTKGLDFENVALVGVINADPLLYFPEFRAHERGYQMLSQVAGRSGRSKEQGRVLIQTFSPEHEVLQQVIDSNYEALYAKQLIERKKFQYPPFYRLIKITLKARDYHKVDQAAQWLGNVLHANLAVEILGPVDPPVARIRNLFLKQILIKFSIKDDRVMIKRNLKMALKSFESIGTYRAVRVNVDVDPA